MTQLLRIILLAALPPLAAGAFAADAPARYTQSAGSTLAFEFTQVDAPASGRFGKFTTELVYDEKNLAASSLKVTVQIASLDTDDAERDAELKKPDLFDAGKYSTASYSAGSLARNSAGGLEAVGKLTIRDVTRDLRLPLTLKPTANGLELSGQFTIRRLDFGVGQGDWKSTEAVGNDVTIRYKVALVKAP
jgi:polyisoprenoid-binding protein YceI